MGNELATVLDASEKKDQSSADSHDVNSLWTSGPDFVAHLVTSRFLN